GVRPRAAEAAHVPRVPRRHVGDARAVGRPGGIQGYPAFWRGEDSAGSRGGVAEAERLSGPDLPPSPSHHQELSTVRRPGKPFLKAQSSGEQLGRAVKGYAVERQAVGGDRSAEVRIHHVQKSL